MKNTLVTVWVAFTLVVLISAMAHAQDSHPIYDTAPNGTSHPIYDNTIPPAAGNSAGIGRSITNLQSVISDLNQAPPDVSGRRDRALQDATAALQELQDIRKSGE